MASLSSEGEDVSFTVLFSSTEQLIRDGNGFGGDTDSALPSSRPVREKREYVNREGSFVTGFDVSTEEEQQKKLERAKRFGASSAETNEKESTPEKPKEDDRLDRYRRVIASLPRPIGPIRPEAVFVYGTDNMSTQDILGYFRAYGPSHLEWIDDSSCNVVWDETNSAKRTLLAVGEVLCEVSSDTGDMVEQQQSQEHRLSSIDKGIGRDQQNDKRHVAEITEPVICPISPPAHKNEASPDPQPDMLPELKSDSDAKDSQQEVDYWRLGQSHPKTKFLLLRQARSGDKKVVGASQKSRYYLLHGNPNKPGNPKGLSVKELRRRKNKRRIHKRGGGTVVEIMEVDEDSNSETETDMVMSEIASRHGSKRHSRLRMHADDVEKGLDSMPMEVDASSQTVPVPSDLPQDDLRHRLSTPVPTDLRHRLSTPVPTDLRHRLSTPAPTDDLRLKLQQRQQSQVGTSKIKVKTSLEQDDTDREVLML